LKLLFKVRANRSPKTFITNLSINAAINEEIVTIVVTRKFMCRTTIT